MGQGMGELRRGEELMMVATLADLRASLSEDAYSRVTQCIGGPERWGTIPIPLNVMLLPHLGDKWASDVLGIGEVVRVLTALGHSDLVREWLCDCIERAAAIVGDRAVSVEDVVRYVREAGGLGPTIECLVTIDLMIAADRLMAWDHEAAIGHALNAVYAIRGDNRFRYWCAARLGAYLDEEVCR
jgi:hypothetical protein